MKIDNLNMPYELAKKMTHVDKGMEPRGRKFLDNE